MNPAQSRSRRIYPKGARGVCPLCYQLLVDCVKCRECGSHYRDIRMPIRVGLGSHLCRASWHRYTPKPTRPLAEDPARPPHWVMEDAANVAGLGASDDTTALVKSDADARLYAAAPALLAACEALVDALHPNGVLKHSGTVNALRAMNDAHKAATEALRLARGS